MILMLILYLYHCTSEFWWILANLWCLFVDIPVIASVFDGVNEYLLDRRTYPHRYKKK